MSPTAQRDGTPVGVGWSAGVTAASGVLFDYNDSAIGTGEFTIAFIAHSSPSILIGGYSHQVQVGGVGIAFGSAGWAVGVPGSRAVTDTAHGQNVLAAEVRVAVRRGAGAGQTELYYGGELMTTGQMANNLAAQIRGGLYYQATNAARVYFPLLLFSRRAWSAREIRDFSQRPWTIAKPLRIWRKTAAAPAMDRSIAEALLLSDAVSVRVARVAGVAESSSFSDSISASVSRTAAASEAMPLADSQSVSTAGEFLVRLTEPLALADLQGVDLAKAVGIAEAMTLAATESALFQRGVSVAEVMGLADSISVAAAGDYTRSSLETLFLGDELTAVRAAVAGLMERMDLGESVSAITVSPGFLVAISEPLILSDVAHVERFPPIDLPVPVSRTRRVIFIAPNRVVRLEFLDRSVRP